MVTEPEAVTVTVSTSEHVTATVQNGTLLKPAGSKKVVVVKVLALVVIEKLLSVFLPGVTSRLMVNVFSLPDALPILGVMWMLASTQLLVAGPDELWVPSV